MTLQSGYGALIRKTRNSPAWLFSLVRDTRPICSPWYVCFVIHFAMLVLTIQAFHDNGRYILSAGHDNVVCMVSHSASVEIRMLMNHQWTLPDLSTRPTDKVPPPPVIVHYPHFFTSEVHSGIVDWYVSRCLNISFQVYSQSSSVAFFGDLVLSRACHEDIIVLWRIEGFSSLDPIPEPSSAPTASDTERLTRSAFAPATSSQYSRLLQFHTPGCGHQFYLRFKLFHQKNMNPVLAFGNAHSEIYFWDLARLIGYHEFMAEVGDSERDMTLPLHRPSWLQPIKHRRQGAGGAGGAGGDAVSKLRDASDRDSVISGRTGSADIVFEPQVQPPVNLSPHPSASWSAHVSLSGAYTQETLESWESKYDMTRVEDAIKAHATSKLTIKDFVGRQVAWNISGEWCVVVGSKTHGIILQRWDKRGKGMAAAAATATTAAVTAATEEKDKDKKPAQ